VDARGGLEDGAVKEQLTDRAADLGAVASAAGFALTLANVHEIVSIVAGVCAALSALAAAYYYVKKARRLGKKPEDPD
jgi:hypothetical protein